MKPLHLKIGEQGEYFAVKHYVKRGFKILKRNYQKKWGEIDIIAKKNNILYFIEVKSVSHETDFDNFLPEENVRQFKKERLKRTINTYLIEKKVSCETDFQIDVAAVYLNNQTGKSKIRVLEDVIL